MEGTRLRAGDLEIRPDEFTVLARGQLLPLTVRELQLLTALVERDYLLELPDSTFSDEAEYVFKHHLEREQLSARTSAVASLASAEAGF